MKGRASRVVGEALARGAEHHRAGRWAEAARAYAEALAVDPEHLDALTLLAGALLRLGRPDPALQAAARAATLDPTHALAQLARARALLALERPAEAIVAFDAALAARPGFPEARLGRARACVAAGRPEEAIPVLREIDDPRARWDLGVALIAAGREEEAAAEWETASRHGVGDPGERARLALRLGGAALQRGDPAALAHLARATDDRGSRSALADAVMRFPDAATPELLARLLAADGIDHQRIEPAVRRALAGAADWTADPLLVPWLRRCIVADAGWVERLVTLRDTLAGRVARGEAVDPALLDALATQAWHNEYAWGGDAPPLPDTAAGRKARAMYAEEAAPVPEPAIAALAEPSDPTSRAVRAQYEAHPYPRLVGVHLRAPVGLAAYVAGASGIVWSPRASPRVLVAGGGTGQHPLAVASAAADAEVVAVDLSRASLARAAALARRYAIPLSLLRGDLLDLGDAEDLGTFDLVDCVGVLHHLADPPRGLRALVARLAPAGLLRLGLYSERGRAEVVAARAVVADLSPDDDGIREARRRLLSLPAGHPAAPIAGSVDLWTQSGLRDLVFHPCEHRYRPVEVGALLEGAGLRVRALQHLGPEPARLYRERWPDDPAQADLGRWDSLEADNPRIFTGMIHVWSGR